MSDETLKSMRHLNYKYDDTIDKIEDCMERQANGEEVDGAAFTELFKKRQTIQSALDAVVKFDTKTKKAVLNEAK